MRSANEAVDAKRKAGPPTLTGSDVSGPLLKLTLTAVEEAGEGINAVYKTTFKPPVKSKDKTRGTMDVFFLNLTNSRMMIKLHGDKPEKWIGKKITVVKTPVRNPQSGQDTAGLRISED